MATIQVRDISEESYEQIRRRARRAGQSIQAYMRAEIERLAHQPTDDELFAEIEAQLTGRRLDTDELRSDIEADRR